VIGGPFRRALAQFAKLGRKSVIHAECFGQLLGHILAVCSARSQIHFLENA